MKKRRNPTKAEREAMASYQAMMLKWANVPKFSRSNIADVRSQDDVRSVPKLTVPPGRESPKYPSLITSGPGGGTKPVQGLRYTGTKMVGIGTLHKSNAVPVFSEQEATDMARMRRS